MDCGAAATCCPGTNPLVPLASTGTDSHTPTSKFVAIRIEASKAEEKVLARVG